MSEAMRQGGAWRSSLTTASVIVGVIVVQTRSGHKPLYKHLYFQVLVAIAIGVILGHFSPALAILMKPLGDAFIKLIKMMIAPIIFTTVVVGIAKMGDMK